MGRVLDLAQCEYFSPNSIAAILARGYWSPVSQDEAPRLTELLARVGGDSSEPREATTTARPGGPPFINRLPPEVISDG